MKLAHCLALGILTASSSAMAADLPTRKAPPAPMPVAAAFSWTGFYIGGYVGGSFGNADMSEIEGTGELAFLPDQTTTANINHDAFVYGGFVGFNYEFPSLFVLGGEIEGGGVTGSATGTTYSGTIPNAPSIEDNIPTYNKLTQPWDFRARARLARARAADRARRGGLRP